MAERTQKAKAVLTDDERGILYRALRRHVNGLEKAASACAGDLWPRLYLGEADRAKKLYEKLTGDKYKEQA
jgi:predicted lipoprotein with Yx(FWY)xxD motif